jgi:DNA invertase Pin-like site-specific DNA recombinase
VRPRPIDIYARQSRKGDKEQRTTDSQASFCRTILVEKGLLEGETFKDDGKSAWNPKVVRKRWDRLMARLESGESGGVIVFDLERFTRQPVEGERLIAAAERGLLVLDSDQAFDLTTASGKKSFRDAMAAAAYYSDRLSDRVRRGKLEKAINGNLADGGRHVDRAGPRDRPFGWEPDAITVRESEAQWIRWAAGHLLHGDSQDALCRHLNARGVTTSNGNPWTGGKLREMLLRERNRGNIAHRGVVVAKLPGEPVLDSETFDMVAAKYAARRPGRPYSRVYLCSGVAFCECGKQLSTRPVPNRRPYPDGEVARQYWCSKYTQPGRPPGGCGTVHIDQRALDAAAAQLAIAILADPRHAAALEAAIARHHEAADTLDALIAEAEATAQAVGDRLGRGEISLSRYDAITGPLDARLHKLRAERAQLAEPARVPARKSHREWQARWKAAAPGQRADLLRTALRDAFLLVSADGTVEVTRPER